MQASDVIQRMTETEILERAQSILDKRAKYNARKDTFNNPDCVVRYLRIHFAKIQDGAEHFTVLYLDNRNRLIAAETPFHGTIDQAAIYPREIVKRAIANTAASVILAHNHPSGQAEPSDSDVRLTEKLSKALALIDVRTLDHVVVGDNSEQYTSLAARGLM